MMMRVVFAVAMLACAVSGHLIPGSYWTALKDMPIQRSDAPAVAVNGVIYIAGGCISVAQPVFLSDGGCDTFTDSLLALDTKLGPNATWTPLASMPRPRYRQAVVAAGNLIYQIGGRTLADDLIDQIDVYNITSNSWSTLPNQTCNCSNVHTSDGTAFVIGDLLYYTGGYPADYTPLYSTVVLNTTLPISQQQFQSGIVPDRWWKAGDLYSITVNNIGYVMGGFTSDDFYCHPLAYVSAYDPKTNTWTNKTNMHHARGDFAIDSVADRYIYIEGGETKNPDCNATYSISYPVGSVERYDTKTDTWTEYAPIAITSFRFTGVAVNDVLYAIGGQDSDAIKNWNNKSLDAYELLPEVFYINTTAYDIMIAQNTTKSSTSSYSSTSISSTGISSTGSQQPSSTGGKSPSSAYTMTASSMIVALIAIVAMNLY